MTLPNLKDRAFSNKVIATIVILHFVSLMMAARFNQLWLNQVAFYGTLALYFVVMPVLWLWHRATRSQRLRDGLSDIRKAMEDIDELPSIRSQAVFQSQKGPLYRFGY